VCLPLSFSGQRKPGSGPRPVELSCTPCNPRTSAAASRHALLFSPGAARDFFLKNDGPMRENPETCSPTAVLKAHLARPTRMWATSSGRYERPRPLREGRRSTSRDWESVIHESTKSREAKKPARRTRTAPDDAKEPPEPRPPRLRDGLPPVLFCLLGGYIPPRRVAMLNQADRTCWRALASLRRRFFSEIPGARQFQPRAPFEADKIIRDVPGAGRARGRSPRGNYWWGFKMEAYDAIPGNLALINGAGGRPPCTPTSGHRHPESGIRRPAKAACGVFARRGIEGWNEDGRIRADGLTANSGVGCSSRNRRPGREPGWRSSEPTSWSERRR